jgi:hypothetical protein
MTSGKETAAACIGSRRRIGGSRKGMQLDSSEANAFGQIDDDELSSPLGQSQRKDQPVRPGRHRLNAGPPRNIDRRAGEFANGRCGWPTARYSARNERYQGSETDDQHHTHHDNKDFERSHAPSFR